MAEITNQLMFDVLKDIQSGMAELRHQIGSLAQGQVSLRNDLNKGLEGVRKDISDMRKDIGDMRRDISNLTDVTKDIALAVDHHTSRLDRIEQHLGLDKSTH